MAKIYAVVLALICFSIPASARDLSYDPVACSAGSCPDQWNQEPSLVQRSHQKSLSRSSVLQSQMEELRSALSGSEGLGKTLLPQIELITADLLKADLSKVDPATKELLANLSTILTGTLMDSLTQAHDEDQAELNNASARVASCNTAMVSGRPATTDLNTTRTVHTTCRGEELTLHGENKTHCTAFHTFLTVTLPEPPNTPMPDRWPPSEAMRNFLLAYKEYGETYLAQYDEHFSKWNPAHGTLEEKQKECSEAQTVFEETFCVWRAGMDSVCNTHATCYSTNLQDFNDVKVNVLALAETRKVEHSALKKILCQIDVLLSDATTEERQAKMNTCANEATAGEFDIVVPTVATEQTCDTSDMKYQGCSDGFYAKEYSGISEDTPLSTCAACPAPTPAPVPGQAALHARFEALVPNTVQSTSNDAWATDRPNALSPLTYDACLEACVADSGCFGISYDSRPQAMICVLSHDSSGETVADTHNIYSWTQRKSEASYILQGDAQTAVPCQNGLVIESREECREAFAQLTSSEEATIPLMDGFSDRFAQLDSSCSLGCPGRPWGCWVHHSGLVQFNPAGLQQDQTSAAAPAICKATQA